MSAKIETGNTESKENSSRAGSPGDVSRRPLEMSSDGINWVTIGIVDMHSVAWIDDLLDHPVISDLPTTPVLIGGGTIGATGIVNHHSVPLLDPALDECPVFSLDPLEETLSSREDVIIIGGPGGISRHLLASLTEHASAHICIDAYKSNSLVKLASTGGNSRGKGRAAEKRKNRKMFGGW